MHTSIRRIVATAAGIGLLAIAGCTASPAPIPLPTTSTAPAPAPAPTTTAVAKPAATPSAKPAAGACPTSPESAPVPVVEAYREVPAANQVSIKVSELTPSSTIVAGGKTVEFSVTVCNSSPVAYPKVALVSVLGQCTCSDSPILMPEGTMERFDEAAKAWQPVAFPFSGSSPDHLGSGYTIGALPKGKVVTMRFRTSLAATMKAGTGKITIAAAGEPGPYVIARTQVPFTVRTA